MPAKKNTTTKIDDTTVMDNLLYYNSFAEVPDSAKKTIQAGNLKGKTDINPMWRIKALTEAFGPVGFGWYAEILDQWIETAELRDTTGNTYYESCAWVKTALYVKIGAEWSKPIVGIGGNKQHGKGKGSEINDEAYKMAYTDSLSVCCKMLGMGANVYWDADATKYTTPAPDPQPAPAKKAENKPVTELDQETYWKYVAAVASGLLCTIKGKEYNYRELFQIKANADAAYMAKFDDDVKLVKAGNNGGA